MEKIWNKQLDISIKGFNNGHYINLINSTRIKDSKELNNGAKSWAKLLSIFKYFELWKKLNVVNYRGIYFDALLEELKKIFFALTQTRWINKFNAIVIKTKVTANNNMFSRQDIILEFLSLIFLRGKVSVIKAFQRLKIKQSEQFEWADKKMFKKLYTFIHTNEIMKNVLFNKNSKKAIYRVGVKK